MFPFASRFRLHSLLLAASSLGLGQPVTTGAATTPAAPQAHELVLTSASAWLRPATTLRIRAPMSGTFAFAPSTNEVQPGEVIGQFDDKELRGAVEAARLQLKIARQQEADHIAELPTRLEEARHHASELKNKLALARAVDEDPTLLSSLPATIRDSLKQTNPAVVETQIAAARIKLARLESPDQAAASSTRLQVMDAEQTLKEAEKRLAAAVLTAPFAGQFQTASGLGEPNRPFMLTAGQEIGTLRDVTQVEAVVPVLSPYLIRSSLPHTELRLAGPGGKTYAAAFKAAVTETSPVTGEARVFVYVFPADAAPELSIMINTSVQATIVQRCDPPITVIPKLQAALDHPNAFRAGWAAGVAKVWPGWKLICEGETELGIAPVKL